MKEPTIKESIHSGRKAVRLIKPRLEDAFVKATGIEIDLMKKEKEKK